MKTLAKVLRKAARTTDHIARYGGEEFTVILPGTDEAGARLLAERLRQSVERGPWKKRPVTVSVGAATLSSTTHDSRALIAAADRALYAAKARGRNRAVHVQQLEGEDS